MLRQLRTRVRRARHVPTPTAPVGALLPEPQPLRSDASLFRDHPLDRRRRVRVAGAAVELRPALPTDLRPVDDLVRRQSLESRFRRFHAPIRELTTAQLAGIVDVDHHERETLVAVDPTDPARLVGVAQYVAVAGDAVEIALLVDDGWQGRGLGRALAEALVAAARAEGHGALVATVLSENQAALHLLTSLAEPTVVRAAGGETELVVPLQPVPSVAPPLPVA